MIEISYINYRNETLVGDIKSLQITNQSNLDLLQKKD